jgi:hypothetical protein
VAEQRVLGFVILAAAAFAVGVGVASVVLGAEAVPQLLRVAAVGVVVGLLTPVLKRVADGRIPLGHRARRRAAAEAQHRPATWLDPETVGFDVVALRDQLRAIEAVRGADDPEVTDIRHMVAALLYATGNVQEALVIAASNTASRLRTLGPHHPHTAESQRQLAVMSQGEPRWLQDLL